MEIGQQLRPEMQMRLSPRMIQSMEILQLPMAALEERIAEEMEKNPALELLPAADGAERPAGAALSDDAIRLPAREDKARREEFREQVRRLERVDDWYDEQDTYHGMRRGAGERDRKMDAMANTAAPEESLYDVLHRQLGEEPLPEGSPVRRLAGAIIDALDEAGYLRTPLEEVVAAAGVPGATVEQAAEALKLVQSFEPAGVAARDLRECLLLQLDRLEGDHAAARVLAADHLEDLAANRLPNIVRKTGLSVAQIEEALKTVRRLQPHPGSGFGARPVPYIVPDVIVDYDEQTDDYLVRLADGNFPNLTVSEAYRSMLKKGLPDRAAKEYLQSNIRSAHWLINSIEQRRHTLLRVARKAVEHQRDYIRYGRWALRPLPMTQVAAELGIHVGTVSRAVHEKYVQTPRGILPLRSFFTGGTQNAEGEDVAWEAVRAKLADIIKNEDKTNPLSDGEIVDRLKAQGLDLARRTVAKYRKILNIPAARQRRVFTDEVIAGVENKGGAARPTADPDDRAAPTVSPPADDGRGGSTAEANEPAARSTAPQVVVQPRTPIVPPADTPQPPPRMVIYDPDDEPEASESPAAASEPR